MDALVQGMSPSRGTWSRRYARVALATGFWTSYMIENWASAQGYALVATCPWANVSGFAALGLLILGVVGGATGRAWPRWLDAAGTTVYVAGVACTALGGEGPGLLATGVALIGLALCWFTVRWILVYARCSTREVVATLCVAVIFIAAAKVLMALLPLAFSAVLVVLFALASVVALRWAQRAVGGCEALDSDRSVVPWFSADAVRSLWTSGVAVAAFLFIWSMLNLQLKEVAGHYGYGALASPWLVTAAQLIDLAGAGTLFWWVVAHRGGIDFNVLWRVAFVCLALTTVSVAYLGAAQVAQVFTSAAYEMADAIVWLTLADVIRHGTLEPCKVASFGLLGLVRVPDWVGRVLVGALGIDPLTGEGVAVGLVAMLVLIAFFLPHRSPGAQLLFAELGGGSTGSGGEGETRLARLDEVARKAGLTARERQIAELLSRGRSKQYIAETLYLSENTVRTYTRRMYAKLDIHSRQELQDLLER